MGEIGIREGHCTKRVKKQLSRWLDRIIRLDGDEDAEGPFGRLKQRGNLAPCPSSFYQDFKNLLGKLHALGIAHHRSDVVVAARSTLQPLNQECSLRLRYFARRLQYLCPVRVDERYEGGYRAEKRKNY